MYPFNLKNNKKNILLQLRAEKQETLFVVSIKICSRGRHNEVEKDTQATTKRHYKETVMNHRHIHQTLN
jgi:hypothetical protein